MGRRALAAAAMLVLATAPAHANGRFPATSTIHVRADHEADILLGMTFGAVLSHDGGATWQWLCEAAVGYGGTYDPAFLWLPSGTILATTQGGLRISRDGCVFTPSTTLGSKFVSALARGRDGAVYAAAASPGDSSIYRSTDDGATFAASASPGPAGTQWHTLVVAPSDPTRVYAGGRSFSPHTTHLLARSRDGGRTFTALSTAGFAVSDRSLVEVAAVAPSDPDLVFVRVVNQRDAKGDAIYRSSDGGQTFAKVLEVADSIAGFVVRANGEVIAVTPDRGAYRSYDHGVSFQALPTSPAIHGHCLIETAAGVLMSCTQNYGGEHMGVARSTDGATWTTAFHYQDLAQPVACPAGTAQAAGVATDWCGMRTQLGVTANPTGCPPDTAPPPRSAGRAPARSAGGCCDAAAGSGSGSLALLVVVAGALTSRRRT